MFDQESPQQSRRMKRVAISLDFLLGFIRTGWEAKPGLRCVEGLPATAQFAGSTFDAGLMLVNLFFSDPSFEEIPLGAIVPFATVKYAVGEK